LDLGLFAYQIQYTRKLLKSINNDLIEKMDFRLSKIPRFFNLKIFKYGLNDLSRLTAMEYRHLMKIMVFIIDNIISNSRDLNKKLVEVYILWGKMYLMTRYESFTENDIQLFEVFIKI
jgi:hypothetical protein